MASNPEEEIRKRLRELEEENARLRKATRTQPTAKLTVLEGEYKGHPILTFQGPFRQFTLGLKKLRVLKEAWPQVESFLHRHSQEQSSHSSSDDDDKI